MSQTKLLWSVMIPSYNCSKYLETTLKSVLSQDLGESLMQIEVVDDCSTLDNPKELVERIGGGRVTFYRQNTNVGATENFNTCISRAKGELIHILHGDDYVGKDFYQKLAHAFEINTNVGIVITSGYVINENGTIIDEFGDYQIKSSSNDICSLMYSNPIKTPAVVIRRNVYEKIGKFDKNLVHCADWEMWVRAIYQTNVFVLEDKNAFYRHFEGNDTSRLIKKGIAIMDYERTFKTFTKYNYPINPKKARKILKEHFWYFFKLMISRDDTHSLLNYVFISYRYLNFIENLRLLIQVKYFFIQKIKKKYGVSHS